MTWDQLVEIAHRKFHRMPPGLEPGLQAKFVWGDNYNFEYACP